MAHNSQQQQSAEPQKLSSKRTPSRKPRERRGPTRNTASSRKPKERERGPHGTQPAAGSPNRGRVHKEHHQQQEAQRKKVSHTEHHQQQHRPDPQKLSSKRTASRKSRERKGPHGTQLAAGSPKRGRVHKEHHQQ